jgi:hypothetical protein
MFFSEFAAGGRWRRVVLPTSIRQRRNGQHLPPPASRLPQPDSTQEDKQRFIDLLRAKIDQEWEGSKAKAAAAGKRRVPRRPDIYAYVQDLGIDPSLIRSHYELPIDMVASSRKNKSRQDITIRKNKQPVSIGQSSNSHVNRTDSAHSNNVRSASNMIPCFPANNSTDVHHCDIVSSRSSPSHFTKDTPFFLNQNI